ncbi:MAG TPA: hypothetical protein VI112_05395 [Bacteroidia bacterium]
MKRVLVCVFLFCAGCVVSAQQKRRHVDRFVIDTIDVYQAYWVINDSIEIKEQWVPFHAQHFFDSLHIIGPDEAVRIALRKRRFKVANVFLRTMHGGHDPEWVIEGLVTRRQLLRKPGHFRGKHYSVCIDAHSAQVISFDSEPFLIIPMHRG